MLRQFYIYNNNNNTNVCYLIALSSIRPSLNLGLQDVSNIYELKYVVFKNILSENFIQSSDFFSFTILLVQKIAVSIISIPNKYCCKLFSQIATTVHTNMHTDTACHRHDFAVKDFTGVLFDVKMLVTI